MHTVQSETTRTLTTERDELLREFGAYLPHIQRRWQAQKAAWARRHQDAWSAARDVAALLHSRFAV
jgi:hypothetical protein